MNYDDLMADQCEDDWEDYICPLAASGKCYVDRDSEECSKCQAEFEKSLEEQDEKETTKTR